MTVIRLALAGVLLALIATYLIAEPGQWIGGACADNGLASLACLADQRAALAGWVDQHLVTAAGLFFGVYVAITAASIPGAAVMTLAGGALFGLGVGTLLVSFASAIGASLAFISARFILRDWVKKRFSKRLEALDRGIERDGAFYLFALRLVPVFPFFVINLAMGLTAMRLPVFYLASQLGMLAGTLVYVNAGTQLSQVRDMSGIVSPSLIASFVLLGVFPLLARLAMNGVRRRRALAGYQKPAHFDRNLIVIGAGSAGLVAALIAATVKARVTLIEKNAMGGDCLNTGCVPSKALLRSARAAHDMRHADRYGLTPVEPSFDFQTVMARVRDIIATIAPHDSVERYQEMGVDVRTDSARLIDPWTVELGDGSRLTARAIVLATGAVPVIPDIEGLAEAEPLTSDTLWSLERVPERLAVIGAGAIGCEMAQAFSRLGASVTLVEQASHILPIEDADIAQRLADVLVDEGVAIRTDTALTSVRRQDDGWALTLSAGEPVIVDRILMAVGRAPRTEGLGLEALGIVRDGQIAVDDTLATAVPTVYACGDAIGGYQLTHAASHEAWHATINALFGAFKRFAVEYATLPWSSYTEPNVAHVGHNESSARKAGIDYGITTYELAEHDRALAESATAGVVKILTVPGKDRILGVSIVGEAAGEWISEMVLAMKQGIGLNKLLATIHSYPTLAEANKFAASNWKKAHAPDWVFPWLARFHAWRR